MFRPRITQRTLSLSLKQLNSTIAGSTNKHIACLPQQPLFFSTVTPQFYAAATGAKKSATTKKSKKALAAEEEATPENFQDDIAVEKTSHRDAPVIQVFSMKKDGPKSIDSTLEQRDMQVFQQSIDKLTRKYESLAKGFATLQETVAIMSTSVQMLTEPQITSRVRSILRSYRLLHEADVKHSPFIKVNSLSRMESYLSSFVNASNIPGAEQAVKDSANKQMFVGVDGLPFAYQHAAPASSGWVTGPLNASRGGRSKSMISGEVTMVGSLSNIAKAIHRAMRYPLLVKRYTLRVQKALFKTSNEQTVAEPMEHVTLFVVMGNLFSSCIPAKFTNRILGYRDIQKLEDIILESFEGEVYIPSDEEIISLALSDPIKDPVGVWQVFLSSQLNGRTLGQMSDNDTSVFAENDRDKLLMLIMLRLMVVYRMDLFLATCNNPLP